MKKGFFKTIAFLLLAIFLVAGAAGAAVTVLSGGTKVDLTERVNFVGGPAVAKSGNQVNVTFTSYSGNVDFAGNVDVTGAVTLDSNLTVTGIRIDDVNDYDSGAGALPITKSVIALTTGGAEALTLADGVEGQRLTIVMVSDGGAGTLTPANLGNGSTLTFDDDGDSVELIFLGTSWWAIGTPTATLA